MQKRLCVNYDAFPLPVDAIEYVSNDCLVTRQSLCNQTNECRPRKNRNSEWNGLRSTLRCRKQSFVSLCFLPLVNETRRCTKVTHRGRCPRGSVYQDWRLLAARGPRIWAFLGPSTTRGVRRAEYRANETATLTTVV